MQLVDTHCHIHSVDYPTPIDEVDANNVEAGVEYLICVGCDAADSERAVLFVQNRPNSFASVGQHPHEAKYGLAPLEKLRELLEHQDHVSRRSPMSSPRRYRSLATKSDSSEAQAGGDGDMGEKPVHVKPSDASSPPFSPSPARASEATASDAPGSDTVEGGEGGERRRRGSSKIVAIGECGLDYFYGHSTKAEQEKALRYQIELALEFDLPLVFHVREAFDDFWPIFDSYQGIRGELHSFTDNSTNLSKALTRGLYIGVNGIMTFTKNDWQLEVAKAIPLDRLLLETDAPFLTPAPLRGKVNEPARVLLTAKFLSDLRHMPLEELAQHTTTNARQVFLI
jgi:Tat protein secretion system quality control protein TatD with DNase activity